jgi:hypothetical protein
MDFLKFLSQFSHVETVIGLIAFIVAAVLGFLLYYNNDKLKNIDKIIKTANTKTKSELAIDLLEVFPNSKIPELTQEQGVEIVKIKLEHQAEQFRAKAKLITIGMVLLFLLVIGTIIKSYGHFQGKPGVNASTSGDGSDIIIGDSNKVTNTTMQNTAIKKKERK